MNLTVVLLRQRRTLGDVHGPWLRSRSTIKDGCDQLINVTHLVTCLPILLAVPLDLLTHLSALSPTKVIYDASLSEAETFQLLLHSLIDLLSQDFHSRLLVGLV